MILVALCIAFGAVLTAVNTIYTSNDQTKNMKANLSKEIIDASGVFQAKKGLIAELYEICKGNALLSTVCIEQTKNFNLIQLAELVGTDEFWIGSGKASRHYYNAFEIFFTENLKKEKISFLEVGIKYGNSLRFWQRVLPHAQIIGLDPNIQGNITVEWSK